MPEMASESVDSELGTLPIAGTEADSSRVGWFD